MRGILLVLVVAIVIVSFVSSGIGSSIEKGKPIHLKSGTIEPEKGSKSFSSKYVVMQFDHILTEEEKSILKKQGIYLMEYIPENSWIAKVDKKASASSIDAYYIGSFDQENKVSKNVKERNVGSWSKNPDNSFSLLVYFFNDVSLDSAREIVEQKGGIIAEEFPTLNALKIGIGQNLIDDLASVEEVKFIDQIPTPLTPLNDGIRSATGVNVVQGNPYNLTGQGVNVTVYDGGMVLSTHTDLTGRVILGEAGSSDSHASHVAGTVAGNGTSCQKGMAPEANIISYDYGSCGTYCLYNTSNQISAEYNESIYTYGSVISTNSIGSNIGLNNPTLCGLNGDYESTALLIDQIVRGSLGKPYISIWAAGNERSYSCANNWTDFPGFKTIGIAATAKNNIVVGAVNDAGAISSFTSWGPTDDGRIRPDIVAPGVSIYSLDVDSNTDCASSDGTSMATPAVAGITALIVEDYRNKTSNADPLPSTVKALLAHTAVDLNATGPDYITGYGLVNATAAIDLIRNSTGGVLKITNDTITGAVSLTYHVFVNPSDTELKLTLAWDDYEGSVLAAKTLVNDLDLVVTNSSGAQFYPWTLNASNPTTAAVQTAKDDTNPIEQVYVSSPSSGLWTVVVNGSSVPQPNQTFSLVSSHDLNYTNPIVTLNSPSNGSLQATAITFNCSTQDSADQSFSLLNVSLWVNSTGWHLNQTANITGTTNETTFDLTLSEGRYIWNCEAYNSLNISAFASNNFTVTAADPPTWSGNLTSIVSVYSPTALSYFNVSWADVTAIGTALFESNWSGTLANYTMTNLGGSVYGYNNTLPAGGFVWRSHANDTFGALNSTDEYTFTITKADSLLKLLLNGTEGNYSILEDTQANLTIQLALSDYVELYADGSLYQNSTANYTNISTFSTPGTFNITAIYRGNQNYTSNTSTWFLTVNDTTDPTVGSASVFPPLLFAGEEINITATVTDNGVLGTAWANISNSTYSITLNMSNTTASAFNVTYNTSSLGEDTYTVTIFANDSYNNQGNSTASFSIKPSATFNVSIFDKDGSYQNASVFSIYYNTTTSARHNSTTVSSEQRNLPQGFWDVLFGFANFNITFLNLNVTADVTGNVSLDDTIDESGLTLPTSYVLLDHVVAANTTMEFSTAQLVIPYNSSAILSESRIQALVCREWNMTAQSCSGSWTNTTNTSYIDTTNNKVTINTTQFSAFAVAEHGVCGDDVKDTSESCDGSDFGSSTCVTQGFSSGSLSCTASCTISTSGCSSGGGGSGGSGGGGGGGGGSSASVKTTTKTETISPPSSGSGGGSVETIIKEVKIYVPSLDNQNLEDIIKRVLDRDLTQQEKQRLIDVSSVLAKDLGVTRKAFAKESETKIETKFIYNGDITIDNVFFYDKVPKSFASNASDIEVIAPNATVKIVEEDPEFLFTYTNLNPGQELKVDYVIKKQLHNTSEELDALISQFSVEVFGESLQQKQGPQGLNLIPIIAAFVIIICAVAMFFWKRPLLKRK